MLQFVDVLFAHRSSLRVLDVELSPFLKAINANRRTVYGAAAATIDIKKYSDANPITRNYAPLPWRPLYDDLERAVRPLTGTQAPAVPVSVWQSHALFDKPWAHLFINSYYPWRDISSKDWAASSPLILTGFLYEYFLVGEYRPKIVNGPGGELRHILLDKLPKDLTEAITIPVENSKEETLIWWDTLLAPRIDRESDDVYLQKSIVAKLRLTLDDDIARITKVIGKASVSKLATARYSSDTPQLVAREIEEATANLIGVSPSALITNIIAD